MKCTLTSYFIIGLIFTKNQIIILKLFKNHIHKVKYYPIGDNFTQALLVMLLTNIMTTMKMMVMTWVVKAKRLSHILWPNIFGAAF